MGTMTFGAQADEKTAFAILDRAYDAGIDFFKHSNSYYASGSRRIRRADISV